MPPSPPHSHAGATALKKPQKVFWGGYSGYYADPDGHVWEVAMNPFWPLNDDGSLTLPERRDLAPRCSTWRAA